MRRVVGAASRRNSIRAQHPMQVLVQCTRLGRQPQFDYDGRMRQVGLVYVRTVLYVITVVV
jgi:hypothetical protein